MTRLPELVTGPWKLADLKYGLLGKPNHGLKVFSCFHCGGGSTMGYKLAGFDVLGGVEIDPEMMSIYRANHSPRHSYLMPIQNFKALADLPRELYELDVLDGSPPCSSFSSAGLREDAWGKEKKFREGQAYQVLDDLFFHFIEVADKLRPKVVVAENVKGLITGKARGYVKEIFQAFDKAGYETQLFLLNASRMGVPQLRERTFFIARRRDLGISKLKLQFEEQIIPFSEIKEEGAKPNLSDALMRLWMNRRPTDVHVGYINQRQYGKTSNFNTKIQKDSRPAYTVRASGVSILYSEPRSMTDIEVCRAQSFPVDFDFQEQPVRYICGMSVPPLMMQRVATEVARTLLANRAD